MNRMRMKSARKMIIGAVAAVATLTVAACGSAVDLSAQSATLTKASFGSAISKATGQATSVHMVMDVSTQGQHLTMDADTSINGTPGAPLAESLRKLSMSISMTIPGKGSVQMRLVGGTVYMSAPGLGVSQAGKPWVKFDLNDPNNPLSSVLGDLSSMNPSQMGRQFQALSTLTNLGSEVKDGIKTTHYKVAVDTSKMATMMGVPSGTDTSKMPKTLTYDMWIDAGSRPVAMSMFVQSVNIQIHFSHWNEPLHIVAPPASQVGTFTH